ncbi:hypothetical protein J6590_061382 [Homalodisca vitripennis]|nr:hypothetical protein J6590_061382 [Homalodisca vitripennis]
MDDDTDDLNTEPVSGGHQVARFPDSGNRAVVMALPPASAVFLKHLQRFPIRGIIVVLYVAADLGVNWYLRDDPPVSDRCSSDYPEFGESLESPLVASDGSVTDDLGRRFPPGQFWSEEDSVYGCPCSGEKPCIRKCCREYQSYNYSYSCVDSDYGFTELLEVVTVTDDELKYVNVTEDHFSVLSSECEVPHRLPAPYTLKYLNPTEDGTVLNVLFGSVFDQSEYCLETFVEGTVEGENEVFVVICLPTPEVREFRDRRLWQRNLVFYVLRVMSATINLVTLAVFCLLPQLRGGCGKSIMCYLIARIYCSLDDAIMTTKVIPTEDRLTCLIASPLALFSALSSRAWQLVIAYQIWSAFRPGSSRASDHGSTRQFLVYSAVAWGTPLATALVALAADQISGAPDFLAPRFAQEQCWFNSHDAHFFYYLVPYYAVELLVIVLCVATLWHLRTSRIGSEALQNAESRSHNVKDIKW